MGPLSDSEIFMFDNPSFDINGLKYIFFVIILRLFVLERKRLPQVPKKT